MFSNISDNWVQILKTDDLEAIVEILKNKPTTPKLEQIFEFARLTQLETAKLVILGQDPYPTPGDAHGLAFSCMNGIPASLKNIYKCLLKQNLISEYPETGDLTNWAKQGVLLINTALTTTPNKSLAHADIWRDYTADLITRLSKLKPMVFILWGEKAKALRNNIDNKSVVLEWGHPSPLARNAKFVDCTNFAEANVVLEKLGEKPIDWNVGDSGPANKLSSEFGDRTEVVFTDGSCFPNKACPQSVGGYAAVFAYGSMKDVILYGNIANEVEYATNQRAEGIAILQSMKYLRKCLDKWDSLVIITDSQFWIDMFQKYMPAWAKKNQFGEKKNPDLTVQMWDYYCDLTKTKQKKISFKHVRSHNKAGWGDAPRESYEYFCYLNNDYVDQLAEHARKKVAKGKNIIGKAHYD